jgi:hypothetical protein
MCEEMGMTDIQFKTLIRALLKSLWDIKKEKDRAKASEMLDEVIDYLQIALET